MCDFVKRLLDSRERAIAQHHCHFSQGRNFQERLDLVQRLAVGGIANAQAVVGERAVLVLIDSYINVTVIEVIV